MPRLPYADLNHPEAAPLVQRTGNRGAVEAAATIAAYNMVSRFLEALQIDIHDAR